MVYALTSPPCPPRKPPPLPSPREGRGEGEGKPSGRHARGLFDDREAHAGLVAVFFPEPPPAPFRFLSGLLKGLFLGPALHQLFGGPRDGHAANHPQNTSPFHPKLPSH